MTVQDRRHLPQPIIAPPARAAIFLTLLINAADDAPAAVRRLCGDLAALTRTVGLRDPDTALTCVMGIGSHAWDRLFPSQRPAELHPFREFRAGARHAMATPGDLLFHIRSNRPDMCFELAARIMARLGAAVATVDEVHGFRYFDDRDLIGFVDGTENPRDQDAIDAALVGEEDPDFAGGSYVITQKYQHDLARWNALPVEEQERAVGRTKLDNVEFDDAAKPANAHSALTVIVENGQQRAILRENLPFGRPGQHEFGTYFIGYCRTPRITEQMLENMFVGRPPGNYDRLLDFTRPVTGCLFFVPSASFLEAAAAADAPAAATPSPAEPATQDAASAGSLRIGSLKGTSAHE